MAAGRSRPAYPLFHRVLHWLIAACVVALIGVGLTMTSIGAGPLQNRLYELHWSVGIVVFVLMIVRLISRNAFPPAPLPSSVAPWQRNLAHVNHAFFYGALLVQPVLGYVGKSAFGGPIPFFGLFDIPALIAKDQVLAERVLDIHSTLGIAILAGVLLHVAGALFHVSRRDGVFSRMITG